MAYGNTTYTTSAMTAFAAEKVINRKFLNAYGVAHPLLSFITERNGFKGAGQASGTKFLLPLLGKAPVTSWAGVADANQNTATTPQSNRGATQAVYEWAHYTYYYWITEMEQVIAQGGDRGDIVDMLITQALEDWKQRISTDLASTTVDSRTKVEGIPHALATATNTVGGIDQSDSTENGWWAAQRNTSVGVFDFAPIDKIYDAINRKGRGRPDLLLASDYSGVETYGAIYSAMTPAMRITPANGTTVKYGFETFVYRGMEVVQDNQLGTSVGTTTGVICMLKTDAWYAGGDKKPKVKAPIERLEGTDSEEHAMNFIHSIGCQDLATQGYLSGIIV